MRALGVVFLWVLALYSGFIIFVCIDEPFSGNALAITAYALATCLAIGVAVTVMLKRRNVAACLSSLHGVVSLLALQLMFVLLIQSKPESHFPVAFICLPPLLASLFVTARLAVPCRHSRRLVSRTLRALLVVLVAVLAFIAFRIESADFRSGARDILGNHFKAVFMFFQVAAAFACILIPYLGLVREPQGQPAE